MYKNAYRDVRLMWYEVLYKKTIWIFIYWKKNTVKKEKSNWKKYLADKNLENYYCKFI